MSANSATVEMELRVQRYSADGGEQGVIASWQAMFRQAWGSRELVQRLFIRDLLSGYRESYLGYAWAVFPTVATEATFTFLNRTQLLSVSGTTLPYPLFVFLGMTVWQFFAGSLGAMSQALTSAGPLITKVRFPREALLLATLGRHVFDLGIRVLVLTVTFALFRVTPQWTVVLAPLLLLPLSLLALGLGAILAVTNAVIRDVGHVVTAILGFWMLLTPVVYPPALEGPRALLNYVNPISPILIAVHDLTSLGCLSQPGALGISCAVSTVVFLLGWRVFYVAEASVAERV